MALMFGVLFLILGVAIGTIPMLSAKPAVMIFNPNGETGITLKHGFHTNGTPALVLTVPVRYARGDSASVWPFIQDEVTAWNKINPRYTVKELLTHQYYTATPGDDTVKAVIFLVEKCT
jgi:hypothetical protein